MNDFFKIEAANDSVYGDRSARTSEFADDADAVHDMYIEGKDTDDKNNIKL